MDQISDSPLELLIRITSRIFLKIGVEILIQEICGRPTHDIFSAFQVILVCS